MPQRPKPKPKPKQYDYIIDDKEEKVTCYVSDVSNCTVKAALWEAGRSDFHDAELQNATAEINKILNRVDRDNEDSSRHLCLINVQGRLMLVWTQHGDFVSNADSDRDIAKALKIKSY
jgi:hypothetical protein